MIWGALGIVAVIVGFAVFVIVTLAKAKSAESAALAISRDQQSARERAELQRDEGEKALANERRYSKGLEAYAHELAAKGNSDLRPDDIVTRFDRLRLETQAAPTGDPVRAAGDAAVRPDPPAETVRAAGRDDLLRPE